MNLEEFLKELDERSQVADPLALMEMFKTLRGHKALQTFNEKLMIGVVAKLTSPTDSMYLAVAMGFLLGQEYGQKGQNPEVCDDTQS